MELGARVSVLQCRDIWLDAIGSQPCLAIDVAAGRSNISAQGLQYSSFPRVDPSPERGGINADVAEAAAPTPHLQAWDRAALDRDQILSGLLWGFRHRWLWLHRPGLWDRISIVLSVGRALPCVWHYGGLAMQLGALKVGKGEDADLTPQAGLAFCKAQHWIGCWGIAHQHDAW